MSCRAIGICIYPLIILHHKIKKMKTLQLLLMAVFTIVSVNTFAQEKVGKKDKGPHTTLYTCPVHDSVAAKKPGNCPV